MRTVSNRRIPGQLFIRYTDSCNSTCPQCGMRKNSNYIRSELCEHELRCILDADAKQKIQALKW